jgi:hypothetical protein
MKSAPFEIGSNERALPPHPAGALAVRSRRPGADLSTKIWIGAEFDRTGGGGFRNAASSFVLRTGFRAQEKETAQWEREAERGLWNPDGDDLQLVGAARVLQAGARPDVEEAPEGAD